MIKGTPLTVDAQQSKAVSIVFSSLKTMSLGLVLCSQSYLKEVDNQSPTADCSESTRSISSIVGIFFLLGLILDILFLIYFYMRRGFSAPQYYIFYGFHIVLSTSTILSCAVSTAIKQRCYETAILPISLCILVIHFHLMSIPVMWVNVFYALKYCHFGSNLVWPIIWFVCANQCPSNLLGAIAFFHLCLSILGLGLFVVFKVKQNPQLKIKLWKIYMVGSLITMFICYLINFIARLWRGNCWNEVFLTDTYFKFGLVELISPALLLTFFQEEGDDPRALKNIQYEELTNRNGCVIFKQTD